MIRSWAMVDSIEEFHTLVDLVHNTKQIADSKDLSHIYVLFTWLKYLSIHGSLIKGTSAD